MDKRLTFLTNKITTATEASRLIAGWKAKGECVVFTNGCFDILHKGHVTYLSKTADCGQRLIVGLNTDNSVRRQGKGEDRPINSEIDRAIVLAALGFVDLIVFFDEDTPLNLIKTLKPDVLTKGADYDARETNPESKSFIVGSDIVRSYGGVVTTIDLVEGYSTTQLVTRLKKN